MTIKPTQEQLDIVEAAKAGGNLRIQAAAGAAKTTTLTLIAEEVIVPSLYLAYNKAMAEEAKRKFPDHVEVRTTHSLAYSHIGREYRHKLERPRGGYVNVAGAGAEIARFYKIKEMTLSEEKSISAAAIGLAVKGTVNAYEYSADLKVEDKHIPLWMIEDFKKRKGFIESTFRREVLKHARRLWKDRTDLKSVVMCTHDTYMKLFQLSYPVLEGYNVIYLDEAADSNACLLDIFERQTAQRIAVGDTYQSIYQWRGSINAMDKLKYKQMCLTQSFRFGEAIGDVATRILRNKHTGELDFKVNGWEEIQSVATDEFDADGKKYTILFRTNSALLAEAVLLLEQGYKLNIETDMSDFVKMLQSSLALFVGDTRNVKHEDIVPFNTWHELKTEGKANGELTRLAKIVEDGEAKRYISILESHYNTNNPDITLTSAHKSKGREWDIVLLADDFPSCYDEKGKWVGLDDQERNLLYVAATRAKSLLVYNTTVAEMLNSGAKKLSLQIGNISLTHLSGHSDVSKMFPAPTGDGASDAVHRAIDELAALYAGEHGQMDIDSLYDQGLIDPHGYSSFSEDVTPAIFKKLGKQLEAELDMDNYI